MMLLYLMASVLESEVWHNHYTKYMDTSMITHKILFLQGLLLIQTLHYYMMVLTTSQSFQINQFLSHIILI